MDTQAPATHHSQVVTLLKEYFGDLEIVGIELGTNSGDLTKTLLRELPHLRLYTVDPWTHDPDNLFESGHPQEELDYIKAHAYNALQEFNGRVSIMAMKSDQAFDEIYEPVNFVWIDGDHMLESVKKDIENGLKKIKPGGILGGHDYATVKEAIDKFFHDEKVNKGADLTWWVYL